MIDQKDCTVLCRPMIHNIVPAYVQELKHLEVLWHAQSHAQVHEITKHVHHVQINILLHYNVYATSGDHILAPFSEFPHSCQVTLSISTPLPHLKPFAQHIQRCDQ